MTHAAVEIAINTLAWHGHDFEVAFAEIAALGARYAEPALIAAYYPQMDDGWFSPQNAARMGAQARACALSVRSVGAHLDLGMPGARAALRRRLEFAADLGARYVHTNATARGRERDFFAAIEALVPVAERAGLTICLENPGDGAGSILASGRAGAELVDRIGSPRVRLNYDFSNTYSYSRGELRPELDCVHALPRAAHMHLKDIARNGSGWRFAAIGSGVVDYGKILRGLGPEPPPLAIELPLRHHRGADWCIALDPAAPPVALAEIRKVMARSLEFVSRHLGARAEAQGSTSAAGAADAAAG